MEEISIKVGRGYIKAIKSVFIALLDVSPIKSLEIYRNAIKSNELRFSHLKELARKADVPYPLFFAPASVVERHLEDRRKNLFEKLPSKQEMRLMGRGSFNISEILLLAKDLGRKQEFLKKRVITDACDNSFVGYVASKVRRQHTNKELADDIRDYFEISLSELRTKSKAEVLNYLRERIERKNVLVSFSSHNFMPQNINPIVGMSGICLKDKKFPVIFINTRDGDNKPKILESDGRQTFTLVAMLVCVAMNRFIYSTITGKKGAALMNKTYQIAGEILIPKEDISEIKITDLEDLKKEATAFKVTPSMLLMRMKECEFIDIQLARRLREKLADEINSIPPYKKRSPLQVNGYGKYNGVRFSHEIIRAFQTNRISQDEMKNILFRKGKMNPTLLKDYGEKFK